VYLIAIYNRLVSLRQSADAAWSDIDVQLKRRYNLIPALVQTVKGYKDYEGETLEKVVKARQMGMNAQSVKEHEAADNMLTQALGKFFALAEAYPDLKANVNFLNLQQQLAEIEDAIQNARRYYNAVVRDYNTHLESFPDLLIAQKFDFRPKDFFELDESEKATVKTMPKIQFD
uniref:LemA family protein n=1 Tax=Nitratifractor sp. TaxID=2268144 RepID=UPI0025E78EE9